MFASQSRYFESLEGLLGISALQWMVFLLVEKLSVCNREKTLIVVTQ